ncbi:MAG TPA: efflux RND transporter periplasmic adaptor subunit [Flavisolibacter sp.]
MTSKNIALITLIMAFTSIFSACSNVESKDKPARQKAPLTPVVEVISPQLDRPQYLLSLPAELKPFEQVNIHAKAKGFVKKIYVDRGSRIKKGQLLAVLEAPEVSQQYLSVQSNEKKLYENYLYSRSAYNRLKKAALKNGAVAEIELDKARAQLRSDSAAYHSAKATTGASAQLKDYLRITAPFDGIVVQRNISVGALVGENNSLPLFTIAQQNHLRLTVAVPEKHAHSINSVTKAGFTVSNRPGKQYQAKLSRNSGVVDPSDRSMMVEFDVDNSDNTLRGGEFAQAKLQLQRPDSTIWVPASSVVQAQSGIFVLVVEQGLVKRVPVSLGLRQENRQEVFGDLTPTDRLIKKGTEELEEGSRVKTN